MLHPKKYTIMSQAPPIGDSLILPAIFMIFLENPPGKIAEILNAQ
jgi:hypothetical protein